MLDGQIYDSKGKMLAFEIETARHQGKVTAFDATNNERYQGQYTGVTPGETSNFTTNISSYGYSASGFGSGYSQSNVGFATAYLRGDKGGMLTCDMHVEKAILHPHGIGVCVGNDGDRYHLQF